MKRLKFSFLALLCLFSLISIQSCKSEDVDIEGPVQFKEIGGVSYMLNENEVSVVSAKNADEISILPYVNFNGYDYVVTKILKDAFKNNTVKQLYIPSTIYTVESDAFLNTEIEKLYIDNLYYWCNIIFYSTADFYNQKLECNSNPIQKGTKLFIGGKPVNNIEIPDRVNNIKSWAFQNLSCDSVTLNFSLQSISSEAFLNSSLKNIVLSHGNYTSVEYIAQDAFKGCENLRNLIILPGSIYQGNDFYMNANYPDQIENVFVSSLDAFLDIRFKYLNANGEPTQHPLPFSFNIFVDNKKLEDVKVAGRYYINNLSFSGSSIKSFTATPPLDRVNFEAFSYCRELESIVLPSSLEKISCSFRECNKLKYIELNSVNPPAIGEEMEKFGITLDENVVSNCILYVPAESVELYKKNFWWGRFRNIIGK